jgi:hypothetical protein
MAPGAAENVVVSRGGFSVAGYSIVIWPSWLSALAHARSA